MNYKKILKEVNRLEIHIKRLRNEELQAKVKRLKDKIKTAPPKPAVIAEAFAIIREADRRVLGMFPTDEQVLGALVLYDRNAAEIKTGEGKSLIATMPIFLKALYMKHTFLVTTNDYLARRDYERIGIVFEWLGLTVADGTSDPDDNEVVDDIERKKTIYSSNIIYISSGTLGFDFLIDGLAEKTENRFIDTLDFALLDEVDEILLDNAQQPLIISGAPKVQSNYFQIANSFVQILEEDVDYKLDIPDNQVWLTERGIERAKRYFSLPELLDKQFFTLYQHIVLALKAWYTLKKNKNYVVEEGKVKLLDSKDGRILEGSNLQSGLHQAIEAKEGVKVSLENQVVSSITLQNLFRQFKQISGMSGTVKVAEDEFISTYNLPVKKIKTHKKNIRHDHPSKRYVTFKAKLTAILDTVRELYKLERAQLIIAGSVESSELISMYLFELGIPHNVLNAKSSVKEAQIIKEAGVLGSVTVSTAMAGRGTDIKLTKETIANGGLAVIITERLTNQRVELQAKGRAGRQGEPGDTYVFESLEDDVIRSHMQERVQRYYDQHRTSNRVIKKRSIRKCFERAQKLSEEKAYMARGKSLQHDEVLRLQKQTVSKSRERILDLKSISAAVEIIRENARTVMLSYFYNEGNQDFKAFRRFLLDYIDYNFKPSRDSIESVGIDEKIEFVQCYLEEKLNKKRQELNDDDVFLQFLKICMLKAVDICWSKQVDALNHIRLLVQHRTIAQKTPLLEFEKEAKQSYADQVNLLASILLKNVALSFLEIRKEELVVTFP